MCLKFRRTKKLTIDTTNKNITLKSSPVNFSPELFNQTHPYNNDSQNIITLFLQNTKDRTYNISEAILFIIDISDYTILTETIKIIDLISIVNIIYSYIDATLPGGFVKVETVGDAYIACSSILENYSVDSLFLYIMNLIKIIPKIINKANRKNVKLKYAIHIGDISIALVGIINRGGFNIFGKVVNECNRMVTSTKPNSLIVSEKVFNHIKKENIENYMYEIEEKKLKNISVPIKTFTFYNPDVDS